MPGRSRGNKQSAEQGLDKLLFGAYAKLSAAVRDIATDIAGQGALKAPVDTGFLRANISPEAQFKVARIKGGLRIQLDVVARTQYAASQHERTDYKHPKGGQAKYLTGPAEERAPMHLQRVARAIREALQEAAA